MVTALEVFAANGVTRAGRQPGRLHPDARAVARDPAPQPRPHAPALADGVVVTPSHNPPADGGFKYNPPNGGPADTDATGWIQDRANELLAAGLKEVRRVPAARARAADHGHATTSSAAYVADLPSVLDLDAIRDAGVRIGADPLGGASVAYWGEIAERHGLDLTVVNPDVDPTFGFMTLDWDGKIRMDCSSPYAMASLIAAEGPVPHRHRQRRRRRPARHRHPRRRLMNPNHYLAVAIGYLFRRARPAGRPAPAIGKTLVSSSMIDRVAADLGRQLVEVPVGFKWFVPGLLDGSLGFGGEESAGASFLRRDGSVWTTDKDGIMLALLASEILAVTGQTPSEHYARADRAVRRARVRPHRRAGHPRGEGDAGQAVAGAGHRDRAGRRADHRAADRGPRQRRGDRRAEGDHRVRLVRRPPVRHRGRLQDLRRVLPRPGAPGPDPGGGPGGRLRRAEG